MFELSEASDNAVRALLAAALLPCVVVLARRALGRRPFHLTPPEHANYRLLSAGTLGAVTALVGLTVIPSPVAAVLAGWVAFVGIRIGSRLHLATPLQARFAFERVEILDKFNVRVECANGRSLHPVSHDVGRFLHARTAKVLTRSRLKTLPKDLDAELKKADRPRDVRRDAVAELIELLHEGAGHCGCLVLEPIIDQTEDQA